MKIKSNIAVSDSGYLFNPSTGESFVINETGKEIIDFLKMDKTQDEISAFIMKNYTADVSTVEKDLLEFIQVLKMNQILENEPK